MKELIDGFLKDKGADLISGLTENFSFTGEEAKSFLPMILEKVGGLFSSGDLTIGDVLKGIDVSSVISKIGVGTLASSLGMAESKATDGASYLLTEAKKHVEGQMGDLGGMFSSEGKINFGDLLNPGNS